MLHMDNMNATKLKDCIIFPFSLPRRISNVIQHFYNWNFFIKTISSTWPVFSVLHSLTTEKNQTYLVVSLIVYVFCAPSKDSQKLTSNNKEKIFFTAIKYVPTFHVIFEQ